MSRRRIGSLSLVGAISAALFLGGCGDSKDANLCDFYHALGVNYTHSQGYIPSDVQDEIDKYC